jgi:hypothetical protein
LIPLTESAERTHHRHERPDNEFEWNGGYDVPKHKRQRVADYRERSMEERPSRDRGGRGGRGGRGAPRGGQRSDSGQSTTAADSKKVYLYGNYDSYYGYRKPKQGSGDEIPADAIEDDRLRLFQKAWFQDKTVLDIGCNTGMLTMAIGTFVKKRDASESRLFSEYSRSALIFALFGFSFGNAMDVAWGNLDSS